jgi:NitT/TauT family transport system permease protein
MSQVQYYLALVAGGLCAAALALSLATAPLEAGLLLKAFLALGTLSLIRFFVPIGLWADGAFAILGAVALLTGIGVFAPAPGFFWMALIAAWLFAWLFVERLSRAIAPGYADNAGLGLLIPVVFGLTILVAWEVITRAGNVPQVILPPPSMIWARITNSVPTLLADFQQTFLKAVLIGYALGCGLGFIVAILIDRSPFLKTGLLPLGNFVSALPIVGVAPIMVMWFGFDWQSKAAVVVIMTFFPMLVNTVAGPQRILRHRARSDAHLCCRLLANSYEAAPSRCGALHIQRPQDQLDSGLDRRNRSGILRDAHCGNGFPDFNRSRQNECRYGVGRNRGGGCRGIGLLRGD